MVDCSICQLKSTDTCMSCFHGDLFERAIAPTKTSVSYGKELWKSNEYCGHCGYWNNYALSQRQFYCIRCGGLNVRNIENFVD